MKNFFSTALYKDALRRTKNLTIALFTIAFIWTGIAFASGVSAYTQGMGGPVFPDGMLAAAYILPAYIFVMGAGLALSAFSFLNKRNASDFWHGIPYSRLSLFVSTTLACITQMLIIIASVLLLPAVISEIIGIRYMWCYLPNLFLGTFTGMLLVYAVTALAMSITGTAFSNLVVTLTLLFLPRFILTIAGAVAANKSGLVDPFMLGVLLNPVYNIPVGMITGAFGVSASVEWLFMNFGSVIYTFVLSILYLAGGAFLFCRRKSEMAGNSSQGRLVQTLTRCAVGLVFALVITGELIVGIDGDAWVLLAIEAALSVIPFMLYELITTRSLKAVVKALPSYGLVVLACVIFFFGVLLTTAGINAFSPKPEEVASIEIHDNSNANGEYDNLFMYGEDSAKITDARAIQLATDALAGTKDILRSDEYGNYDQQVDIVFNMKSGASVTRTVRFGLSRTYSEFMACAEADEAYVSSMEFIPDVSELEAIEFVSDIPKLTCDQMKELWISYSDEMKESGNVRGEALYDVEDRGEHLCMMYVVRRTGYKVLEGYVDLFEKQTPKTAQLFLEMISETNAAKKSLRNLQDGVYPYYTNMRLCNSDYVISRIAALGIEDENFDKEAFADYVTDILWLGGREGFEVVFTDATLADKIGDTTVKVTVGADGYGGLRNSTIYVNLTPGNFDRALRMAYEQYVDSGYSEEYAQDAEYGYYGKDGYYEP